MAEAFGVVAGVAGLASLIPKIISGIDTLREVQRIADKAPAELDALADELKRLNGLIEEASRNGDFVLEIGNASLGQVISGLEKLKRSFAALSESKKTKLPKFFVLRHWKEDTEALQVSIRSVKLDLIRFNTHHTFLRQEEHMQVTRNLLSSSLASISVRETVTTSPSPITSSSYPVDKPAPVNRTITCTQSSRYRHGWNCAERHCSCRCHHTVRIKRRFSTLAYTPGLIFRQTCNNKNCNGTKRGVSFNFTLSQCGIPWSATIELFVLAAQARFSLRPAFQVEHIVRYTSPGFETLLRYQEGIITVKEAREKFLDLFRSDSTLKNHVNPAGRSYIEELVRAPRRGPVSRAGQYSLLELFMGEFGMTRGTKDTRFLIRCAKWIGEGPHLELLDHLLDLGLDVTLLDSPLAQNWPSPSSPNWIAEDIVDDPFFLKYLGKLLSNNQGFADMSPLHEAVLLGSDESFNKWLSSCAKDEKNFLDQTPMHLATSNCQRLVALIEAGHNLDATDIYGITPLMYAAGSNSEDCFVALLDHGAEPNIQCTRYNRTFVQYAAVRGNWDLLFAFLCWLEKVVEDDGLEKIIIEGWARMLTTCYYVAYPDYLGKRKVLFQQFLAKCSSVDFMIGDQDRELHDSTLLHYVRSSKEIDILLEKGFTRINHVNSAGQHALITAIYNHCNLPDVARKLLAIGVRIDIQDNSHYTALHHILYSLPRFVPSNTWRAIDTLCVLLANDADPMCIDKCRCPCSLGGCLPCSALRMQAQTSSFYVATVPIWSLEWLTLVLKHRNVIEARAIILSFIRKAKFDELGMTHVCCGRRQGYCSPRNLRGRAPIPDEDIDAILEEEREFDNMLKEEMALSSAKPYEELLDEWIQQIKAALQKSCIEASDKNKSTAQERVIHGPQPGYEVDSKKDCFRFRPFPVHSWNTNPAESAKREIVEYIYWMEYEYHCGKTSRLCKGVDGCTKDDWYFSRFSWLFKLVNEVGISLAEIAASMREKTEPDPECLVEQPIRVEEITKHLITSWRTWEDRRDL